MELIRPEKIIFVDLPLLPSQKYALPELVGSCALAEVPATAVAAWEEGFKPSFVFASHSDIGKCAEIPMLRRRWRALAKDRDGKEIASLEQHLPLHVVRGLAGRDLLVVDDDLRDRLITSVRNDAVIQPQFQQLEAGIIDINQLELIDEQFIEYSDEHDGTFYAQWVLDPRVVLKISFVDNGEVLITCDTPEALIPPAKLVSENYAMEFNRVGAFPYAIRLTIGEHGRLITDLAKTLDKQSSATTSSGEETIIRKLAVVLISCLVAIRDKANALKTEIISLLKEISWRQEHIPLLHVASKESDANTNDTECEFIKGEDWTLDVLASQTKYVLLKFKQNRGRYEGRVVCLRNKHNDVIISGIVQKGEVRSELLGRVLPPLDVEVI